MDKILRHKVTVPILAVLAVGLLLLGFVVEWKAALCIFMACWFDNILESIKKHRA